MNGGVLLLFGLLSLFWEGTLQREETIRVTGVKGLGGDGVVWGW